MAEPVKVRRLTDQEGQRLQQIGRRGSISTVRYRRAMMILASAGGNRVPVIARLVPADEETVRDVILRFNEIGLACVDPRWAAGGPFPLLQPRQHRPLVHGMCTAVVRGRYAPRSHRPPAQAPLVPGVQADSSTLIALTRANVLSRATIPPDGVPACSRGFPGVPVRRPGSPPPRQMLTPGVSVSEILTSPS
jgi:hypothetical protein